MGGFAFSTLGSPGASLAEIVAIAGRGGCGGLELRSASGEAVHPDLSAAEVRRSREELVGVVVLAVASYVRLCAPVLGGGVDDQLVDLRAQIELAAAIGATGVRVFMGDESVRGAAGPSEGEQLALRRLSAVNELCARRDVSVFLETHDSHSRGAAMSAFCTLLDERVPGHCCGVIWDTAHSWSAGESPGETLRLIGPWLAYLQIKDLRSRIDPEPVLPGAGSYPIGELADVLKRAAWRGWFSLEWERKWYPELQSIDVALTATRIWARGLMDEMGEQL